MDVQVLSAPSRFSMQKMLDFVCGKWRVSVITLSSRSPILYNKSTSRLTTNYLLYHKSVT